MNAHPTDCASAHGLAAPERSERNDAHELGGGVGIEVQGIVSSPDSAHIGDKRKPFANAQARAALQGAALDRIEADEGQPVYILSRGAWLREFVDLAAVEAVLAHMEGSR